MQETKKRWERYRAYGLSRGLNAESAEDFAQETYIRFLEAGKEISMSYSFVDFVRSVRGRPESFKAQAHHVPIDDFTVVANPRWDLDQSLTQMIDEACARGLPRREAIRRLALFLGIKPKTLNQALTGL